MRQEWLKIKKHLMDFYKNPLLLSFGIYTLVISLGFLIWAHIFGHIGLDFSFFKQLGAIPNSQIKLFVFEQYFLLASFFGLFFVTKNKLRGLLKNPLSLMVIALLIFSLVRLAMTFKPNPILAIRNSAFCWYLFLCLSLSFIPKISKIIETVCFFSFVTSLIIFVFTLGVFYTGMLSILMIPFVPFYPFLILALTEAKEKKLSLVIIALIGIAFGTTMATTMQRTLLVGISLPLIFVGLKSIVDNKKRFLFLRRFALWMIVIAVSAVLYPIYYADYLVNKAPVTEKVATDITEVDPLKRGETNSSGMEMFRAAMWKDAFDLFRSHPVGGIGFQDQVVYRVYDGFGKYLPNDGCLPKYPECRAPISGPHNSYINALARIGIIGVLFFILHVLVCWLLFKEGWTWTGWAIYGQMIYGAFNVGLEGPVRSFLILLAISSALAVKSKKLHGSS
ncbi:MAG: O-antigen ligase family protein [Oligoflexia bacterium]|nr:O-antigen ligase family protein [Oligoflexia bacterium]